MSAANIRVTTHTLQRWQERGAEYADVGMHDVIRAFRESRRVEDDEPIPIARTPGVELYRHERANGWFVAKRDHGDIVVITFKHSWIFSTAINPANAPKPPPKRDGWMERDWLRKWPAREVFMGVLPAFGDMNQMIQWLRNNEAKFLNVLGRTATHTGEKLGLTPELVDAGRANLQRWMKEWREARRDGIDLTKPIATESSS